jgi:hypothetical protein
LVGSGESPVRLVDEFIKWYISILCYHAITKYRSNDLKPRLIDTIARLIKEDLLTGNQRFL